MVRFQCLLEHIETGARPDWLRLAMELGYADQAHLIRDFSRFSGLRPGTFGLRDQT
jgi:AraC-like DNA-binding protein